MKEEAFLGRRLLETFKEKGWTLAVAESCTGGLLSSILTDQPGVSEIYKGAVVSYSDGVKEKILNISTEFLESYGAVSEPVAIKMAQGVRQALESDWSVSITGVAGPGGGSPEKPVGTVCFSVCGPNFEWTERTHLSGDREKIRRDSAHYALELLLKKSTLGSDEIK